MGSSRPTKKAAIAPDVAAAIKAAIDERLAWLNGEWTLAEAADALVSLWKEPGFSHKSELGVKQIQLSLITTVSDAMMRKTGSHVEVARAYRDVQSISFNNARHSERDSIVRSRITRRRRRRPGAATARRQQLLSCP